MENPDPIISTNQSNIILMSSTDTQQEVYTIGQPNNINNRVTKYDSPGLIVGFSDVD